MDIKQIISQSEGRRLEFKESLPEKSDLVKSIIAFSNDAGGDLYVGIKDKPREVVGIPSSIDFSQMETGQSDARNRIIAPVFKRLGIIDQWGNGLKLVADELRQYPEIEFVWKEVGLSLQIQFIKKNFKEQQELGQEQPDLQPEQQNFWQELKQELQQQSLFTEILLSLKEAELSKKEISDTLGQKEISGQLNKVIRRLISKNLIERTIPDSPNHPAQKHRITERGHLFF